MEITTFRVLFRCLAFIIIIGSWGAPAVVPPIGLGLRAAKEPRDADPVSD